MSSPGPSGSPIHAKPGDIQVILRARCASEGDAAVLLAEVGPRTVVIQSASSCALLTVALRHTNRTCTGRWMMTSSHTGPR